MGLRADLRAAATTLLTDYAASAGVKLQVYSGRPASVYPPTAFVDLMPMRVDYRGISLHQDTPTVQVILLHGAFDSKEAVDQADAFVDGFVDYVSVRPHAAGANRVVGIGDIEEIPVYVSDWLAPEYQRSYFATQITLEGYAEN